MLQLHAKQLHVNGAAPPSSLSGMQLFVSFHPLEGGETFRALIAEELHLAGVGEHVLFESRIAGETFTAMRTFVPLDARVDSHVDLEIRVTML